MKLVIATGIYPPQVGGPATYSKLLKDKLPEYGWEVEVINFGEYLKYPKGVRHILYLYRVWRAAASSDLVYAQDPVSVGLPALLASRIAGKKFYLKIVGDYAWEQAVQRFGVTDLLDEFSTTYEPYPKKVRALKRIEKEVANGADQIIVPSQYLKKVVSNWGVPAGKIEVIYNSFNPPHIISGDESLAHPSIISAGRLVPWKGFASLIEMMPELEAMLPGIHLYIAGDGPERDKLLERISDLNAEHLVTLLGSLSREELFRKIKSSDVFVLNTAYEGFSHQLLEVMALETPIVTTTAGGNPEMVVDQESGRLVAYDDKPALKKAILEILTDRESALKYAYNAKNRIQRFSESKMLNELVNKLRV